MIHTKDFKRPRSILKGIDRPDCSTVMIYPAPPVNRTVMMGWCGGIETPRLKAENDMRQAHEELKYAKQAVSSANGNIRELARYIDALEMEVLKLRKHRQRPVQRKSNPLKRGR